MYIKKKWVPTIMFVSLAIICAFLSLFLPWWSIGTAPEAEKFLDGGVRTEYRILKTVLLYKRTGEDVFSLYVYLKDVNVTSNQNTINEIDSIYNTTMLLQIAGLVIAVVVLTTAILLDKRILRNLWIIGMLVSAALILVAPLYFMNSFASSISKLDQFTPVTLPAEYIPISPSNVTTFFGNTTIPKTASSFPSWVIGQRFWVWGAGIGFFLALAASIMLFTSTVLISFAITKKSRT